MPTVVNLRWFFYFCYWGSYGERFKISNIFVIRCFELFSISDTIVMTSQNFYFSVALIRVHATSMDRMRFISLHGVATKNSAN